MGLIQRAWAKRQRLLLRRKLGMKCCKCGSKDYRKLEFDCIVPTNNNHGKWEWSWRMSYYRKQYREQNLQLLCDKCHNKKTGEENSQRSDDNQNPF